MQRPCKNEGAPAIKSREFSQARFALRKVHLANIDRNNLRFTSLHFSRTRCIPVVNGETDARERTENKIKSPLLSERPRMYAVGRGNLVSSRERLLVTRFW
ncbi:hypothetical protein ALC53_04460 [Atta colombica]|uniref:Uncharacterized protein n=1 Tax=Atta colombica TaxID=520822 RepID=A0A195BLN6_9HYME|nr:hypothetical protein ALC53_04460 [Atta colombica]